MQVQDRNQMRSLCSIFDVIDVPPSQYVVVFLLLLGLLHDIMAGDTGESGAVTS